MKGFRTDDIPVPFRFVLAVENYSRNIIMRKLPIYLNVVPIDYGNANQRKTSFEFVFVYT